MTSPDLSRAADAITEFLRAIGVPMDQDPELAQTGAKVAEAFANDLLEGYRMDPAAVLADTTETSAPGLVLVTHIPTTLMCPHHLLPAQGVVHVSYLPGGRVVGLGALGKLVQCFARRLILQEEMGQQVVDALIHHLGAEAAGCVVDLAPLCMTARGGRYQGARAVTTAFAGRMREDALLRSEMLQRIPVNSSP